MQSLGIKPYHKGLVDLGRGGNGRLQPDGGRGLRNAGLIADSDCALLVDTHTLSDSTMLFGLMAKLHRSRR